jgi:hypothetical protein
MGRIKPRTLALMLAAGVLDVEGLIKRYGGYNFFRVDAFYKRQEARKTHPLRETRLARAELKRFRKGQKLERAYWVGGWTATHNWLTGKRFRRSVTQTTKEWTK